MTDTYQSTNNEEELPIIKERKRWLLFGLPFTFTTYILDEKNYSLEKGFLRLPKTIFFYLE